MCQVAVGKSHSLVSTTVGDLFGAGSNDFGELGSDTPVPVHDVVRVRIDNIAPLPPAHLLCCGDQCSFVVVPGRVFASGKNTSGLLGTGTNANLRKFTAVTSLDGKEVLRVDCGLMHSAVIAVDSSGRASLFGCGRASFVAAAIGASLNAARQPQAVKTNTRTIHSLA